MPIRDRLPTAPSGFEWIEGARGVVAVRAECREALAAAGFDADSRRADERFEDAEESGREPLARLDLGGTVALVRRFTHGGLARRITGRVFRDPTRPFVELRLSEALRSFGLSTPRVLAARAVRVPRGYELALAVERVEGTRDVGRILGDVRAGRAPRRVLRRALVDSARLIRDLHGLGFVHADLQPANILVRPGGARGALAIDLDRSHFEAKGGSSDHPESRPRPLHEEQRVKNLARLWRHVRRREREYGAVLTPVDLALFLAAYGICRASLGGFAARVDSAADARGVLHRVGWWLERTLGRGGDSRAGALRATDRSGR